MDIRANYGDDMLFDVLGYINDFQSTHLEFLLELVKG